MTVTSLGNTYDVVVPKRATYSRQFTLGNRAEEGDAGAVAAGDGRTWYVPVDLDDVTEIEWLLYPDDGQSTEPVLTCTLGEGIVKTTPNSGLITATIDLDTVEDLPLIEDGRHVLTLTFAGGQVIAYLYGELRVVPEGTAV